MSSSQPSTVTQKNTVELSPQQQEVFGMAMPLISEYASTRPKLKEGSSIAGFTPEQMQAQQEALGVALPQAKQLSGQAGSAQSKLLDPNFMLKPNDYLLEHASNVRQQGGDEFMEQIAPAIRKDVQAAGGSYSGGSTRGGIAEGLAAGKSSKGVSDAIADMFFRNYQTGLTGMQKAVTDNDEVMNQSLMPSNIMNAVGGEKQKMQQALMDEEAAKFYAEQDIPLLQAQQIMALLGQMPGSTGVGTVQGAMPKSNPLMPLLGAGLTLMSGGMPFGAMAGMK